LLSSRIGRAKRPRQTAATETTEQKVEHLTRPCAGSSANGGLPEATDRTAQQLEALQQQMAAEKTVAPPATQPATANTGVGDAAARNPASLGEIRERQAIEESQIATHDVTKVETESKYPLKVSGLLLFNGFREHKAGRRRRITGLCSSWLRQHGALAAANRPGVGCARTACVQCNQPRRSSRGFLCERHAVKLCSRRCPAAAHCACGVGLAEHGGIYRVDRTILEPNEPSSLVAIAQPELAWAGNLWSWSPQIGVSHQFALSGSSRIEAQAALIDPSDPKLPWSTSYTSSVTQTERSRWLGTEGRIAYLHGEHGLGPEIGVGGYFSPHRRRTVIASTHGQARWTMRLPLTKYFEVTANAYRGQALAGLGGGGYVNYYYEYAEYDGTSEIVRMRWTMLAGGHS
jgi:hypothetical protein